MREITGCSELQKHERLASTNEENPASCFEANTIVYTVVDV